jgi:beta-mannanase
MTLYKSGSGEVGGLGSIHRPGQTKVPSMGPNSGIGPLGGTLGFPGIPFIPAQGGVAANRLQGVGTANETTAEVSAFETFLGTPVTNAMAFANGTTWANLQANAVDATVLGTTHSIHWSVAIPSDGTTTLAQVAAGMWDSQFKTLANLFLATRPSDAIIFVRIFWEFQNTSFAWNSVGKEASYTGAFRRVTQLFLNISKKFRFIWCPAWNTTVAGQSTAYNPVQAYPGNQFVDVVGMDVYYTTQTDGTDPNAAWRFKQAAPFGLNFISSFAFANGKPQSIDEWGINTDVASQYISAQLEWFEANNVALYNYFDVNNATLPDFQTQISGNQYPTAGARFQHEFSSPAKTNLFTDPNVFTTAWSPVNVTFVVGQPDPFGSNTATAMFETTANGNHLIQQNIATATTASFTGVVASGVLTASAVTGTIHASDWLNGTGITSGVEQIAFQISGTTGGAGTYQLNNTTFTLASVAMQTTPTYRMYMWAAPIGGRAFEFSQVAQSAFAASAVAYYGMLTGDLGNNVFAFGGMAITAFEFPDNLGFFRTGMEIGTIAATPLLPQFGSASADGTDSFAGSVTEGLVIYTTVIRQIGH